ncbi:MAG TPA: 4-hydroxy-tetrahydrodipicolinate synthase [Pseudothermotoga sp.]|nr:4-hydroxy-tetrahydrodipicolinate synthase [Pseudothermotoga sp.]HOK83763.1 4-hydroxy-tetrahydrodipicolinate synthase [Pseudothermotoga sp.]HPP70335.1 4-hydroxy-tetrahydrodipicolinate synthase [Pseudothermotoga sp.]
MGDFTKFGRILVPMITPFHKSDQSVDYKTARKVARYLKENKLCDSLIVAGTTGEFYTLSFDERIELFKQVKDELAGEVPLIAGVGSVYVGEAIKYTQIAEELGYDAIMVVAPYYCKPEQEGIYAHFKQIAQNTSLPVMVYNIPLFTGVNIAPETLARLCEIDNIFAIKDEAGVNPLQATEYIRASKGRIPVYSGDDTMVLQVITQGGVGVVSGGSHIIGHEMREMIDDFISGRVEKAKELFQKLFEVFVSFRGLTSRINPTPMIKAAFEFITGLPTSMPRMPLLPAADDEKEFMKKILKKIGKI